jgi:ATP-binding cassette, subfamily B, bacterial
MPGGMFQQVGEMRWQLSHGECSRLFIARALLQEAEVVILDEALLRSIQKPFNALCLACSNELTKTLVVITHP